MKRIGEKIQKNIKAYKKAGFSISQIAESAEASISTVKRYTLGVKPRRPKSTGGRYNKLSDTAEMRLVSSFRENKVKNLRDVNVILEENFGVTCTKSTIKRYLDLNGLRCWMNKPFLSSEHRRKRFNFAKKYSSYGFFD
jgi:transposase